MNTYKTNHRELKLQLLAALAGLAMASFMGQAQAARACSSSSQCNDGKFCNGVEICSKGVCASGAPPCTAGCDETRDMCLRDCDADGDGVEALDCGGTDCDDWDMNRFPGNTEMCHIGDPGHDEDCDYDTVGVKDTDRDGYTDRICFNASQSSIKNGDDCNDSDPDVHPTEAEVCNGKDDNCDGAKDENLLVPVYPDRDLDGFGRFGATVEMKCPGTPEYSPLRTDCSDADAAVYPGVMFCVTNSGPTTATYCDPRSGQFITATCPVGTLCAGQPNGTGICK